MNLDVSIIVSTYNRPEALYLVLRNICLQMDNDSEVIVADDGSTSETQKCIQQIKGEFPKCKIHHVWQADQGFRLARIRNLAVKSAKGEYLIFLDGDCIPSPHFIKKHKFLREPGWTVYGQRILIGKKYTNELERSIKNRKKEVPFGLFRLVVCRLKGRINRISPVIYFPFPLFRKNQSENWKHIRGCNWGMWKRDYEKVNGCDESFQGWGSEDKDLAVRLLNYGIKIKNGKFGPYVLHLWHEKADRNADAKKMELVEYRRRNKITLPKKGMSD